MSIEYPNWPAGLPLIDEDSKFLDPDARKYAMGDGIYALLLDDCALEIVVAEIVAVWPDGRVDDEITNPNACPMFLLSLLGANFITDGSQIWYLSMRIINDSLEGCLSPISGGINLYVPTRQQVHEAIRKYV
jgi:hypothetical protein